MYRKYAILAVCSLLLLFSLTRLTLSEDEKKIPVTFELDEPGYVTLVIENEEGKRVRNLINDTRFEAGKHTIYWDGYDVGDKKDKEQKFDLHKKRVEPGTYNLRGLVHEDIKLRYKGAVQSPGNPPWHTSDNSGGWLADHTPPIDVVFLPNGSPVSDEPQMMISASGAEAGHGTILVNTDGKKLWGTTRGVYALGRDRSTGSVDEEFAYGAIGSGVGRFLGTTYQRRRGLKPGDHEFPDERPKFGMSAYDGIVAYSRFPDNEIVFFTGNHANLKGKADIQDPRGLQFTSDGKLYLITGKEVQLFDPKPKKGKLGEGKTIITGLQNPRDLSVNDENGLIFVSDWGDSHQVKVFSMDGQLKRKIGKPGGKQSLGLYDEKRMHHPAGMAMDNQGRLWVAEHDYAPKRVSIWDVSTGEFEKAYYGPPKYGGGGHMDPRNENRYFYSSNMQGIEYEVDWESGTSKPRSLYWLKEESAGRCPATSIYHKGNHYLLNTFFGPSYFKAGDVDVFRYNEEKGIARRIVHMGFPGKKLKEEFLGVNVDEHPELKSKLTSEVFTGWFKARFFIWSDLNLDGMPQAEEIQGVNFGREPVRRGFGGVSIARDFSITKTTGAYVPFKGMNENGVPTWDLDEWKGVFDGGGNHISNAFWSPTDDIFVDTMNNFSKEGRVARGYRDGEVVWKRNGVGGPGRPDPVARYKGQLVNAQRHIGQPFTPDEGEGGPMFALNGFRGNVYILTTDGLYVTDIGGDARVKPTIGMKYPEAENGMIVDDVSWGEEHFWPATDQMEDGTIYYTAGERAANLVFRVEGLETIRRIGPWELDVSENDLSGIDKKKVIPGELRKKDRSMDVAVRDEPVEVDGDLDEWSDNSFVDIHSLMNMSGAISVHGNRLYLAYRTDRPELLNNNLSRDWSYAFATGGGLDLMIRTKPGTEKPDRHKHFGESDSVTKHDVRIFITRNKDPQNGDVVAARFQQKGGDRGREILYESPIGETRIKSARDVSDRVKLAQKGGMYEVSIPLDVIGVSLKPGTNILGDIGVLTGNGSKTLSRSYWSNKASTMVSDIPTEARLKPHEWGIWRLK